MSWVAHRFITPSTLERLQSSWSVVSALVSVLDHGNHPDRFEGYLRRIGISPVPVQQLSYRVLDN